MVFSDRLGNVLAAKDLCCSAASVKHSPYKSKHVVFIYDLCLKNIAQAASQRYKSHLVLYAYFHRLHLKMPEGFHRSAMFACAIMFPFTYFLHLL